MKKILSIFMLLLSISMFSAVKTWNGANWSGGGLPPTVSDNAHINGPYNGPGFICKNLSFQGGNTLTINNGVIITVDKLTDTNNGFLIIKSGGVLNTETILSLSANTFIIESGGSLMQPNNNSANAIIPYILPEITVQRTTNVKGADFVYWSSPVMLFNTNQISSVSSSTNNAIYKWNPTVSTNLNGYGNWSNAHNENMTIGNGYITRFLTTTDYSSPTIVPFTSTFIGVPNNGNISVNINSGSYDGIDYDTFPTSNVHVTATKNEDNWNLIGNPYPSALDAEKFLVTNTNIYGFVKIWTHGSIISSGNPDPFYGNYTYNYTVNDYITYNKVGSSFGPNTFTGNIASGQGFFVLMNHGSSDTDVNFNNSMRNTTNTNFYRTTNSNEGRVWLDLYKIDGTSVFNIAPRILVGYNTEATNGEDRLYDALTENKNSNNFYSLIGNNPMIIQGRSSFITSDIVPLGFKSIGNSNTTYNYSISISSIDGILSNQTIYLKDNLLNITHNLSTPYQFTSEIGVFNDRFELRYESTLSNNDLVKDNTSIYSYNNQVNVKSDQNIKDVKVYDMLGRIITEFNNVNSNDKSFTLNNDGVYIVKVKLENDAIITKKIAN